jgi:hypothetical protein
VFKYKIEDQQAKEYFFVAMQLCKYPGAVVIASAWIIKIRVRIPVARKAFSEKSNDVV